MDIANEKNINVNRYTFNINYKYSSWILDKLIKRLPLEGSDLLLPLKMKLKSLNKIQLQTLIKQEQ